MAATGQSKFSAVGQALLGGMRAGGARIAPGLVIASAFALTPVVAQAQTVSVNNTSGSSSGSFGFFLDRPSGAHVVYGQAFTALHPTLESYSIRAFSELSDNPNTKFRGAIYAFDTATLSIANSTPIFSSGLFDHPAVPVNGNHNFVVNTSGLALTPGTTYAAFIGADYASFRADTSITGLERFFLNTTANLAPGAKILTRIEDRNNRRNNSETPHAITDFNFTFVEACNNCDAWSTLTAGNVAQPLQAEVSQTRSSDGIITTTIFNAANSYFNFVYTPSPSSDISGAGSFLTSGLGTSVNPVFAGGTLTGAGSGAFAQNFTVTPAAGSAINTNGNALTFSGNFTNGTPNAPANLSVSGAGSATFTGSFGSQTDRMGTLTNSGAIIFGGSGVSWFDAIINSGTFSIQQGATVHDDLENTGTFNNAGQYFAAVNNSTASGIITNDATGVWTGNVLSNTTGASITNNGSWIGDANNNGGTLINTLTWNGSATNSGTLTNNAGATWTGTVNNQSGGAFTNGGDVTGLVTNAGVTNTTGTLSGGLTNQVGGTANAAGAVNGQVSNNGAFNVTGNLTGNNSFTNSGTGQLLVTGGNYTGLTTLANNSTAATGINVAAGNTLSAANVTNAVGASFVNAGTLTSTNLITNNGTLTTTGTVNGGVNNAAGATINAAGTFNGQISNSGTFNVTGALNVLPAFDVFNNDASGRLNVTGGNFTGLNVVINNATAADGVNISTGRTLGSSMLINNAGASILNGGTLTSTNYIDSRGVITSTGTINSGAQGLFARAGATTNASGAVNGIVDNAGAFNVTGALTGNSSFANQGTGQLQVNGGNYTGLTQVFNTSTAAVGIDIAATRTLSAGSVFNNPGATLRNAGTLSTTSGITNTGTLNSTGALLGGLGNAGTANLSGSFSGNLSSINAAVTNITGNFAGSGSGSFSGISTSVTTVNSGATWSGLLNLSNSSTAASGLTINGTVIAGGQLSTTNGATTTISSTGVVTATNGVSANSGGRITNDGVINSRVTNAGTLASTNQLLGGLTNNSTGTASVRGALNGTVTNSGALTVTGNLASNNTLTNSGTSTTTVNAGAAWTGLTGVTHNSTNTNGLVINGAMTLASTGGLTAGSGSTVRVASTGAVTLASPTNPSGAIFNLNGNARFTNDGTVTGFLSSNANGSVENNGSWIGVYQGLAVGSTWVNNGTWNAASPTGVLGTRGSMINNGVASGAGAYVEGASGVFTNNGTYTHTTSFAFPSQATLGGLIQNTGTFNAPVLEASASGRIINSGAVNGNLRLISGGTANNQASGALNGTVLVSTGTTLTNAGAVTGLVTSSGTVTSTGTLGGGVSNSGSALLAGVANGAISNQGGASLTVNGALSSDGALTNSNTGQVIVNAGAAWTGLTGITNSSTNVAGVTVNGALTTSGLLTNGSGSTFTVNAGGAMSADSIESNSSSVINNAGTITALTRIASLGLLTTTGAINGGSVGFSTTSGSTTNAAGAFNGFVSNGGAFNVTGALTGGNGGFSNAATGRLVNAGSVYSGLGVINNAAGGRIILGDGLTNGVVSGARMTNAGSIELMNGRVGDEVRLSGAYAGIAGSTVSVDVNMASNANLADRIVAGGGSGATLVSLQNIGAGRIYFSQPIVIASGAGGANFTIANDASTRAALASDGVIDYAARTLSNGVDWGIVASLNTGRSSSIATDTLSFAALSDIGETLSGESLTAGPADASKGAMRFWSVYTSGTQDVATQSRSSDVNAISEELTGELNTQGYRLGGSYRLFTSAAGDFDVGVSVGESTGKAAQTGSGVATRFEMPTYGAHMVFTGESVRASLQVDALDLDIDAADVVTTQRLSGEGVRVRAEVGLPMVLSTGTLEPYARLERAQIDIDRASLAGGRGFLTFDTQETNRLWLGAKTQFAIPAGSWSIAPSLDMALNFEDASGATRFTPPGSSVVATVVESSRTSTFLAAEAGVTVTNTETGLELFATGAGRSGADVNGVAINVGARLRF